MPTDTEQLKPLFKKIPCRRKQIEFLVSTFGEKSNHTWPAFFVYGHTGTGKTYVVKTLMQELKLPHAVVNCAESYSLRLFFGNILKQISGVNVDSDDELKRFTHCDNMNDFVKCLPQAVHFGDFEDQTVYVVLDRAEKLRDTENLTSAFLKLKELTKVNVCVVMISELTWDKFRSRGVALEPLQVHFPSYTKSDLYTILCLDAPDEFPLAFYEQYINLVLRVFYQACRNVTELQHLASLVFPKYREPVRTKEIGVCDTLKLFYNVEPHLKKLLRKLYLRDSYSDCLANGNPDGINKAQATALDLPFYSKYLLLASYIASYNPAMSDKRFFVKKHGKIMKHSKLKTMKHNNQIQGPKMFPLDRMLAIFYSIIPDKLQPHAAVYSQISSLVSLHLLSEVEKSDALQTPKYKCLVSLDMIRNIAKTVNFDIIHYLYDFLQ